MAEKIVISFDDETPKKPEKAEEKIVIDFKPVEKIENTKKVKESIVNFQYRGNPHLTGSDSNELDYPAGLENGFGKIFSVNFKNTFLNSLLLNNKFIILSSASGSVYFVDRFKGDLISKCIFENDAFERTGMVLNNNVYLNSVKCLYGFDETFKEKILYKAEEKFYIWSHLNKAKDKIVFLEYSPEFKKTYLVCYNSGSKESRGSSEFSVTHFLSDSVVTTDDFVYIFFDNKILKIDIRNYSESTYELNFQISPDTNFMMLDGKIYFNNGNNELFYFDTVNEEIKFTGIKCGYINSLGAVSDNIFIGQINGWQLFKTSGMPVYTYDDIVENKIESLNRHILIVSKGNKIIFHNLDKFQEAEGFSLSSGNMLADSDKIISARIGEDAIFVLSKNGILEAFNNDKLNIVI
jgi:hypothetical protein